MGVDLRDVVHFHAGQGQQFMADAQAGGADDGELFPLDEVVNSPDGAVGAVFNGHHAELAQAGLHGGEHGLKALDVHDVAPGQQAVTGHLGIGALHALAGHQACLGEHLAAGGERSLHLRLHLGGGGDELRLTGAGQLENGGEQVVGKALPVAGLLRHLGQDLPLPLLVQNGLVVLVLIGGHLFGQVHPLQKQVQQLVVHGIDLFPNLRKFHDYPPIINPVIPSR